MVTVDVRSLFALACDRPINCPDGYTARIDVVVMPADEWDESAEKAEGGWFEYDADRPDQVLALRLWIVPRAPSG
jgi:hypothetical protein